MEGRKLLEELKKTVDALQTFGEIGKTLTSTLDIQEVLRVVLQKISDLLHPTSWSLLMLDEKTQALKYEILINEPSIDRNQSIKMGQGVAGWAAQNARPVLWPDFTRDKRYSAPIEQMQDDGSKSIVCIPLKSKGKILGVIDLRRKGDTVTPFSEEDLASLAIICDYAAIAIENARNFQRVQELTITDDLTTLFNVRHMHTLLDTEILRAQRYKKAFSMVFLDLDKFKQVNDTWGHIHGSQLLRETANIIQKSIRSTDYAARYGGDEFVVLLPETNKDGALLIAERLRKSIEQNEFLQDKGLKVHFTASFGVATFPEDAKSKDDLIRMADAAMYEVKGSTRNSVAGAKS